MHYIYVRAYDEIFFVKSTQSEILFVIGMRDFTKIMSRYVSGPVILNDFNPTSPRSTSK